MLSMYLLVAEILIMLCDASAVCISDLIKHSSTLCDRPPRARINPFEKSKYLLN